MLRLIRHGNMGTTTKRVTPPNLAPDPKNYRNPHVGENGGETGRRRESRAVRMLLWHHLSSAGDWMRRWSHTPAPAPRTPGDDEQDATKNHKPQNLLKFLESIHGVKPVLISRYDYRENGWCHSYTAWIAISAISWLHQPQGFIYINTHLQPVK